jgi:large subunit ribosomal protein L6
VKVTDNNVVTVKGPKGTLEQSISENIQVAVEDNTVLLTRNSEHPEIRALHGLSRTLIYNMIVGVTEGYKKELEINGVGYRASKEGKKVVLNLGFSHPVVVEENDDVKIDGPAPNKLVISGIDKQKVGQFAADVRKKRPPEPYKGKGIKYANEVIRRKEGKSGAKK